MKKILPFVVMLAIFLMTACGSSAPTAATTQSPAQPAATEAPAQSNAAGAPAASGNGTEVDIKLADNTIDASTTIFQVGVPYKFVITNTGRHAHNFTINPPVSVAGSLDEALNRALLAVPQEQLRVGKTATVDFIFPESAAGQLLEFSCLIRQHYEDGMHIDITVTK